jgi:hypothetical protein
VHRDEDEARSSHDLGTLGDPARNIGLREDLFREPVVRAGGAERVEVGMNEHRSGSEGVRVADPFRAAISRNQLEDAALDPFEPTLCDKAMGKELGSAV